MFDSIGTHYDLLAGIAGIAFMLVLAVVSTGDAMRRRRERAQAPADVREREAEAELVG